MTRCGPAGSRPRLPVSPKQDGLLTVALVTLVVAAVLMPASWWAVLGLLTTLVVIPWMLLRAIERKGFD